MNILSVFVLFAILLKCVAASEDDVGVGFKEAVDEEDFGWLRENWRRWGDRDDLLDYVIEKGADCHCLVYSKCWGCKTACTCCTL